MQAQLKGRGLKVFAGLEQEACRNFVMLKQALLTAYELPPEVYRKRFRTLQKAANETHAYFAFKLVQALKRWLQGTNASDDINFVKQAVLTEQFLENVNTELKL